MDVITILTIVFAVLTCLGVIVSLLFNLHIKKIALYWMISLVGAIILVLINVRSFNHVLGSLVENSSINPLKILVFFLCMTILSITLDNLNFFRFLANKCTRLAKNSQFKLFLIFYWLVSLLTVFTSNDIVILAFVPFICYFCKNSNINPVPYVFSTFVAANTWSMMLVIGNPTNVYISTFAGIDFVSYFLKMAVPTVSCGIVAFLVMLLLFRKHLKEKIEPATLQEIPLNKPLVWMNVAILASCTIMLAISSYINLEMWYLALGFAILEILLNLIVCMIKKYDKKFIFNSFKKAPWAFVPFLLSMFLIIMCLDANGITTMIGQFFAESESVLKYGCFSFLFSNLMNNIPMTALFASILSSGTFSIVGAYATIIGSNLGAILTPVGALAGIMFMNILKEKEIKFSIKSFIKYGVVVSVVSLATSLGVLYVFI